MFERIVIAGWAVPEVPKVTGSAGRLGALSLLSRGPDQPVGHQAEPEIQNHAEVEVERAMPRRRRQRRDQDKIHHVAQDDRQQGLEKIDEHRWFRHHEGHLRMPPVYAGLLICCKGSRKTQLNHWNLAQAPRGYSYRNATMGSTF